LYQAGEATQKIFDKLLNTDDDYQMAKQRLEEYFTSRKKTSIFKHSSFIKRLNYLIKQSINLLQDLSN